MSNQPEIIIIVAVSENSVIGKYNSLPWRIKEDLIRFKKLTMGYPCLMGRKTYESLPIKPLPGRKNIVITTKPETIHEDVEKYSSIHDAIKNCSKYEKLYICGGSSIYKITLNLASRIEMTKIHANYNGDVFFPEVNLDQWKSIKVENKGFFSFITYIRKHKMS